MHRHRRANGHDAAAEIERVARVGIGPGRGEHLLFVQIAGGAGADGEANQADRRAKKNGARSRARQKKSHNREEIADAHAPTGEKIERRHAFFPRDWRTALNTSSTERANKEGSGTSPRP